MAVIIFAATNPRFLYLQNFELSHNSTFIKKYRSYFCHCCIPGTRLRNMAAREPKVKKNRRKLKWKVCPLCKLNVKTYLSLSKI